MIPRTRKGQVRKAKRPPIDKITKPTKPKAPPTRPINTLPHGQHIALIVLYRYGPLVGQGLEAKEVENILESVFPGQGFNIGNVVRWLLNSLEDKKLATLRRDHYVGGITKIRYSITDLGIDALRTIAKDVVALSNSLVPMDEIRKKDKE